MEEARISGRAGQALAEIRALIPHLDGGLLPDAERLALLAEVREVAGQLLAVAALQAAAAEADDVALRSHGTSLASWLAGTQRLTRREAHRLIWQGRDLARFPLIAVAALSGSVGFEQASAIGRVLSRLPEELGAEEVARAEATMLELATDFDSAGLAGLSRHLIETLDPVGAEERDARRLERDLKLAKASRHLIFTADGQGSVILRGSLPVLDAEPFVRLVDAYAERDRRAALDRLDPLVESVTPAMRRADALCTLAAAHQQQGVAPLSNGDLPRIVVTLDYGRLRDDLLHAQLIGSGDRLTAGQLRTLACDADLLPAVLGGESEVLDVGRAHRLVTPALRTALTLRDQGCILPGCDKPPAQCHAHHLIPWWVGGLTVLENLALVCAHHHNLVEPARHGPPGHRWEIIIGDDHLPAARPPTYVDPQRRPRLHQRFRFRPEKPPGRPTEPDALAQPQPRGAPPPRPGEVHAPHPGGVAASPRQTARGVEPCAAPDPGQAA